MTKHSKGKTPSPVAVAGAGSADSTTLALASWAYRPGMPEAHSNEAQAKSDALAAKGQPFAPGLARLQNVVRRDADPDDTANDPSLRPGWKPPRPAPPAASGKPPRPSAASTAADHLDPSMQMAARHKRGGTDASARPTAGNARQARPGSGAPSLSPKQSRAFNQANQHFEQSHMQTPTQTPDQGQGDGVHRGWSPQARIAAAKARNVQNLPYGGDPTQAPDYVEPKDKSGS
jgi:hypothetical protein